MHYKIMMTVFTTVFLAELGDKTQIATFLFSCNNNTGRKEIFVGASAALILSSAIGVFAGSLMSQSINTKYMSYVTGILFIIIGCFSIYRA